MKQAKKLLSVLLAVVLVLALGVTAFASGDTDPGDETPAVTKNDSITVSGAKVGETYNLYKLFDLKVNDEADPTAYSYTVNEAWKAFFEGDGAKYITVNDAGYVTEIKDDSGEVAADSKDLAKAAAAWAKENNPTAVKTVEADSESFVFAGLADGYYLITSSLGTLAMIETTPDKAEVTVNEKNPEDTIEKEVKEGENWGTENDAQVGDKVEFRSTVTVNPHSINVKVHDTMTDGLTYNKDVKVYTDEDMTTELPAANYEVLETADEGDTFTVRIKDDYVDGLTEAVTLYIGYSATLNEKAIVKDENGVAIKDQENKTHVTFGDNSSSEEDKTDTTTHKFEIKKFAANVENLAGAVFAVKRDGEVVTLVKMDDTHYRVATEAEINAGTAKKYEDGKTAEDLALTDGDLTEYLITVDSGNIVVLGVDSETYTISELLAPEGYNKLTEEKTVEVDAENGTIAEVENKSGSELPSTGGIGTTIFYVVGGVLVIGAAVLLITRRRVNG